jgi:hypothetical protein
MLLIGSAEGREIAMRRRMMMLKPRPSTVTTGMIPGELVEVFAAPRTNISAASLKP